MPYESDVLDEQNEQHDDQPTNSTHIMHAHASSVEPLPDPNIVPIWRTNHNSGHREREDALPSVQGADATLDLVLHYVNCAGADLPEADETGALMKVKNALVEAIVPVGSTDSINYEGLRFRALPSAQEADAAIDVVLRFIDCVAAADMLEADEADVLMKVKYILLNAVKGVPYDRKNTMPPPTPRDR